MSTSSLDQIMADILVAEWMEEFDSLTESEIHTYATEQEHNHEVMIALFVVLEEQCRQKHDNKLVDGICRQLLEFYRSGEKALRRFVLQYIPVMVYLHLSDIYSHSSIATFLVSLYNLEVVDDKGQPKVISFRVPSIAQSSIYHDSSNLEAAFIAENSLRRWEECNTKLVSWGPLQQVDRLNAQNRQRVVTALVFLYNQHLASFNVQSLEYTCRIICKLVSQGFHGSGSTRSSSDSESLHYLNVTPRLTVSSQFLLELLQIIYHSNSRGITSAVHALHEITRRASYEVYSDVLLVTHALDNLIHHSPSPALTPRPSTVTSTISKSMITNASFRTKKLPDDIPIQESLNSITEEHEETEKNKPKGGGGGAAVGALKHLPKLPGLSKKHKTKQENVEMIGEQPNSIESVQGDTMHGSHVSVV